MNIDGIWKIYGGIILTLDRLKTDALELLEVEKELREYIIEYYGITDEYFREVEKRYSPESKINWSVPHDIGLLKYIYKMAYDLIRRDIEEGYKIGITKKAE